ncbi:MAG: tetratricopeptide repeat protein [Gammaproteobacteria bacterium]|nr:tetratricopeptide repeat protein [Gammaproteobacteria bacterium]
MRRKWNIIWLVLLMLAGCALEDVKEPVKSQKPEKQQVVLAESDKRAYNKALRGIKAKRYKKALVILNKLLKKYPDAAGPLANKGIIYVKQKKQDKAEKYFLKALDRNENLVQVRNHLAVIYRKQGKFSQAKDMLDAAIATDPYYANAYYNLGILYELYLQIPEKALENYQLYLDLKKQGDKRVAQWVSLLQRQLKAKK